jgi:quercetin dioxygenase-like cupin family protein
MPSDGLAHSHGSKARSDTHEIFSPQQDVRPTNQYLTELTDGNEDYCVMLCILPHGVVVPMHSHADRETFYIVSGTMDAFRGDHWEMLSAGDVFDVKDGIKHAWRNSSGNAASMLCVTTMRLGRFIRDIAVDGDSSDPQAAARHFQRLVEDHGYWLASPDENSAIGLNVNWGS